MKRDKKKNLKLFVLSLILLLGIGFAAIATQLKIDGTLNVSRTSWDVHFENVVITEGSVIANPEPTTNNVDTTEMTYTINFTKPGDFFEFTTDVVNDGTIDAMIDTISNNAYASVSSTTPITLPNYLANIVTYGDGNDIQEKQELLHGTSEKIKVRVEFKKDISASDLPSSGDATVIFKFKGDFLQADGSGYIREHIYKPGDLVYFDPVTQSNCSASTFDLEAIKGGTSTCYKWRVLTVGDTATASNITLQMDHNIVEEWPWVSQSDYDDDDNYGRNGNTNKGPITALKKLESETQNWTIPGINYSYDTSSSERNYGVLSCANGACTVKGNTITSSLKARLITGEEVKTLTMNAGAAADSNAGVWTISSYNDSYWFSSIDTIIGTRDYAGEGGGSIELAWLVENTEELSFSGATKSVYSDNETTGYWSLTPVSKSDYWYDASWYAWDIFSGGAFYNFHNVKGDNGGHHIGLRPVIEIEKSKLN